MKYWLSMIFLLCLAAPVALAQTPQENEKQELRQKLTALYQQGKLDEAISLAEKLARLERKDATSSLPYANALTNLAVLRTERLRLMKAKMAWLRKAMPLLADDPTETLVGKKPYPEELIGLFRRGLAEAEEVEKLWREALSVYERAEAGQSVEASAVRNELAWLLYNFIMPGSLEFSRSRIDEAEKLFADARAIRRKSLGENHALTLRTEIDFANFYLRYVNFEKALPLYESYLRGIEKNYSNDGKLLLRALRPLQRIALTTENADRAEELRQRILKIGGQPEQESAYLDLSLRSKNSLMPRALGKPGDNPKVVMVKVLVGEDGKVLEAVAVGEDKSLKQQAEEDVSAWLFRPFKDNGEARKMRGVIPYRSFN
jgi:hypothetical protein